MAENRLFVSGFGSDFSTIPFPQCALCRKQVDEFSYDSDQMENNVVYRAKCHGRYEDKVINRHHIGISDNGLRQILGVFFVADASMLNNPQMRREQHSKLVDAVNTVRPKRMLDK